VLIDCGKTFREVVLKLFPQHGLKEVGALLLTHGHADAILGMDDLRDLQQYEHVDPGVRFPAGPTNIFLHEETMQVMSLRMEMRMNHLLLWLKIYANKAPFSPDKHHETPRPSSSASTT